MGGGVGVWGVCGGSGISAFIDSFKLPIPFHALKRGTLGVDNTTVRRTSPGEMCQKSFENSVSGKFTTARLYQFASSVKPVERV